jgi:3-phosphoshikimate 1-carboxyvinyltransferase
MMSATVLPAGGGRLHGTVSLPTSKSLTNRALVAAAVAGGGTIVSPLDCDDTRVLAAALQKAGWPVEWQAVVEVGARSVGSDRVSLDVKDSGTGSRLLIALLAASRGAFVVDGSARLRERPMGPLFDALDTLGATVRASNGFLPAEIDGRVLTGGPVDIRPEISSQFVSALVLAGPLMRDGLELRVSGPLPSAPYLDLTVDVMRSFGSDLAVTEDRRTWRVAPVPLQPTQFEVEGDWSATAFFLAAVAVAGGELELGPLDPASRQGDRAVLRILADAGLDFDWRERTLIVRGPIVAPLSADLSDTPDLFPALAATAACAPPGSQFSGLDHLKHKESDRLATMVANLERLGAILTVRGPELQVEATVDSIPDDSRRVTAANDHRIAMAMAVAALGAGRLELDDPSCVSKSFPRFWDIWESLIGPLDGGGSTR